jgi:hypothetical protein
MAVGLQFKNASSEIIVDSDFHHYHYIGKATYISTTRVPDLKDGNNTAHSTTAGQYMSASQVNGDIIKYQVDTRSSSAPPPMCFIKPISTGNNAPRCAIVLTEQDGAVNYRWNIWVLQERAGTHSSPVSYTRPTLYCFSPHDAMTNSQRDVGTETLGVATFNSSGSKTYDSRLKPLKLVGAGVANSAPSVARTNSKSNGWSPYFTVDTVTNYTFSTSSTESNASDLMFYAPSLAHCCQEHRENTDGDGFQSQGYNSYFYAWARSDLWYCFYRNTFRFTSKTNFQSSYTIYASGHVWKSVEDSSSIFTAILAAAAAFVTFGASLVVLGALVATAAITQAFTNSGTAAGTYYPYIDDSRNRLEDVTFLLSKASYYD